jgi:hypothetical protein
MTDTFGFDPKTLNNDELYTRQIDLTRKKVMAARLGHVDTINQLDIMINAIDNERRERMFLDRTKMLPQAGVVIETDPALRETDQPSEQNEIKTNHSGRPVRRTVRTSMPVLPTDGV